MRGLSDRAVAWGLGGGLLLTLVSAAMLAARTLDARGDPNLLSLTVGLVAIAGVTGLAARWGRALLRAVGVSLLAWLAHALAFGFSVRNTPSCHTCDTCCEGAGIVLAGLFPILLVAWLLALPLLSGLVRAFARPRPADLDEEGAPRVD